MFILVSSDRKYFLPLGTQASAKWSVGSNPSVAPSITYTTTGKTATIDLICSSAQVSSFVALGEVSPNIFKFRLTHRCACFNECQGKNI